MKKHLWLVYLMLGCLVLGNLTAAAQATFASEEELKAQAAKLFDEDEFEEAYPLYSQLLSIYPKDPNYNFRLGVCMLFASEKKEKAIPYLEFAVNKPDVEKEAIFYLARAYHLNYRFDDAIRQYLAYKKVASEAKAEKLMVDRQIEMCRSGKKLLRNLTDLIVLDKKELSRADFFRAYDISDIGGKLLVKPDEPAFKSAIDKKKKEKSIIYLATNNNQIYFSSYGTNADQGKDIFLIRKLPNGEWSKPQTLGYPVNTEYDEDFPFLHPNGKVLYFCSKGHNSMGGYDIFKTSLNEETGTWNKPVNMDFPINTPDDDNLYVTNEDEKEAFFSSARNSPTGKTAVYHINVERRPIDVAIIKGQVVKNRDNQALDIKITVKDLADNSILGIFNAKAANGVYLMNLPNGGKFMYTVEATGFSTQSEVVELPTQYVFKPLKQEISYELGTNKLIIKNLFDEPVDEESYLLALNFIKEKSKMEVSSTDALAQNNPPGKDDAKNADAASAGNSQNSADNSSKATTSLSNEDIVRIASDDAKEAEAEAKDLQEQADIALNLANQKNELAQNKVQEATQLMADANSMEDNVKKQATIDEANAAFREADELNQETVAAFNIAKKLQIKAAAKDEEAELSLQYAKDLEAAVRSKDPGQSMAKLEQQEKKLEELSKKNGKAEPDDIFSGLKLDEASKKRELDKAVQLSADLKQEMADNETLIASVQADADKTKKEDLKKGLLDQIVGLKEENIEKKKELEGNENRIAQLQKEYNGIRNEMALVDNVVSKSRTGSSEEASASVATIDKSKLEAQVNEIKTSEPLAAASTISATASSTENNSGIAANTAKSETNNTSENSGQVADNSSTVADNAVPVAKEDYNQKFRDQLAEADGLGNALVVENKKTELYKEWNAALDEDIKAKKNELKTEKDKAKKKELSAGIAQLEKGQKDIQRSISASEAAVAKLKKDPALVADAVASNAGNNKTVNDNSSSETNTVSSADAVNNAASEEVRPVNINAKYSEVLAGAEKIGNEEEKKKAKAEALNQWAAAIEADAEKKRTDMNASTDPEMKALLAKKISDAELLAKEKRAEADRIAGQDLAVNNNSTNAAAGSRDQSNTANTASSENASAAEVAANKTGNSADPSLNTAETNTTGGNNVTTTGNNTGQNNNTTTAGNNTGQNSTAAAAGNNTGQVSNTASDSSADIAANSASETSNEAGSDNAADAASEKKAPVVYNTITASAISQKAEAAEKEAESLSVKAEELRTEAASRKKPEEKDVLLTQANTLSDRAEAKKLESMLLISDANEEEIRMNQGILDQYAAAAAKDQSDEVVMAEMMKDEAKLYAAKAQKSRDLANGLTSASDKEAALEDAQNNERISLEKQQKATALYKKNNPALVPYTGTLASNTADQSNQSANKDTNAATASDAVSDAGNTGNAANANSSDSAAEIAANKTAETGTANNTINENPASTGNDTGNTSSGNSTSDNTFKNAGTSDTSAGNSSANTALTVNSTNTATETGNNVNSANETGTANNTAVNDAAASKEANNTAAGNTASETTTSGTLANNTGTSAVNETGNTASETTSNTTALNTYTGGTTTKLEENEKFERTVQPVYSASKPIPVDVKLPEGLVFKVQIGAFRNPIPPETFSGMSPITAETTPQGLTRYTAGLFTRFSTADQVKMEIRSLGYKDAFVVAFLNGKRIPMNEALAMAGITPPAANASVPSAASEIAANTAVPAANTALNNTTDQNVQNAAVATNVTAVGGLFYTVQVGVYSQPVPASRLKNCQPLYSEKTANGMMRYTTGIYNNTARAMEARMKAYNAGITDAYVTAYYNGKRIPLPEAEKLIREGAGMATADGMNALPSFGGKSVVQPRPEIKNPAPPSPSIPVENNTGSTNTANTTNTAAVNTDTPPQPVTVTTPVVSAELKSEVERTNVMPVEPGVIYKVQIGAFRDEVPLDIANKYLKIAKKGIRNYKDENGLTIYTVGSYKTYEEAVQARTEVLNESGVEGAFVVAYSDGKKVSIDEAKALQNK